MKDCGQEDFNRIYEYDEKEFLGAVSSQNN
jgi:hypothetical protein